MACSPAPPVANQMSPERPLPQRKVPPPEPAATTTTPAEDRVPVGKLEPLARFVPKRVAVLDHERVVLAAASTTPESPVVVGVRAGGEWLWTHREAYADDIRVAVSAERVAVAFRQTDINRVACEHTLRVLDADGNGLWAWNYKTHAVCNEGVEALAIDAANNVYVAFEHGGRAKLDAITPKSRKVLVSFSPSGKRRWHQSLPPRVTIESMAVRGTTLALAATADPDAQPDFGHGKRTVRGFSFSDGIVATYDTDGRPGWDGALARGMASFGKVGGIGIMQDGSIVAAVSVEGTTRRGWVLHVRGDASGHALPPTWTHELPQDVLPTGLVVGDDDRVVAIGTSRDPTKLATGRVKHWHEPDRGLIVELTSDGNIGETWIREGFLPASVSAGADGKLVVAGVSVPGYAGALLML